jgi:hypothetical protein
MKSTTLLALALAAGLTSFAGNAKASIVFRNFDLTVSNGQTLNFGFDGTSITSGSGQFSLRFSAPVYHPEETFSWTFNDVDYSYTYPAFTTPLTVRLNDDMTDISTQSYTAFYTGTQGSGYGPTPKQAIMSPVITAICKSVGQLTMVATIGGGPIPKTKPSGLPLCQTQIQA